MDAAVYLSAFFCSRVLYVHTVIKLGFLSHSKKCTIFRVNTISIKKDINIFFFFLSLVHGVHLVEDKVQLSVDPMKLRIEIIPEEVLI